MVVVVVSGVIGVAGRRRVTRVLAPRLIRAGLVPREGEEIMNAVARTYPRSLPPVCRESRNFFIITGGGTNTRAPVAPLSARSALSSSQHRNLRV